MKISRVINYDNAICDYFCTGFNFGYTSLFMDGNLLYVNNKSHNYEDNFNTNKMYKIEEIETFIVTKH